MLQTPELQTIRRADYTVPDYLIDTVQLTFDLQPAATKVYNQLTLRRNPARPFAPLTLAGKKLTLVKIELNQRELTADEYHVTDTELVIHSPPEQFTLEIETLIHPDKNTELEGLYISNDIFCTQCEAHGFSCITYFLDRPDVMAVYTTKLIADKQRYPQLLSNGNLIETGDLPKGKHFAVWHDPFKKPCYLFAVVAGKLDCLESHYTTRSGRHVTLRIFSEVGQKQRCHHAMASVKHAMQWDEEKYGREYDLDIFMIVAVSDFNMGAMENKGLNIFNAKYILADSDSATDVDYEGIQIVVGHEYFHNWTGDRITCRDWFQLSLKEGLTVFRDQEFNADLTSRAIARIDDVKLLRSSQFPEDAGPMAHPVRPDAYIEVNNFYTATVYNKGAEVIRMMQTLLTPAGFRRGMDLYFDRHDGQAVTCDDFVKAMEDANQVDFTQFKLWYSQAGTPVITVDAEYDKKLQQYSLTLTQSCPATPDQPEKMPMHIPVSLALFDHEGRKVVADTLIELTDTSQTILFENMPSKPVPSLLRNFSAPVKLNYNYTTDELYTLLHHDDDAFNRWDAGQKLAYAIIDELIASYNTQQRYHLDERYPQALLHLLKQSQADPALVARILQLPTPQQIAERYTRDIPVEAIVIAHHTLRETLALRLYEALSEKYIALSHEKLMDYNANAAGVRQLQNTCLYYMVHSNNEEGMTQAIAQYHEADNMTNRLAALSVIANREHPTRQLLLDDFYSRWQQDDLVLDKWFGLQSTSELPSTLDTIKDLLKHSSFSYKNPNKVRALIGAFAMYNFEHFHGMDGMGYLFLAEQVRIIDRINPQIAARLVTPLTYWQPQQPLRQDLMQQALQSILDEKQLSANVYEIVSKALKGL